MKDKDFVRSVLCHPDVWPFVSDDGSPDVELFGCGPALENSSVYILIPSDMGVFMFVPWNTVTYELHTAILPGRRGAEVIEAAGAARRWMFEHTSCRKVVTHIPDTNKRAMWMARRCGMEYIGNNKRSFLKNGIIHDMHIYGICLEVA